MPASLIATMGADAGPFNRELEAAAAAAAAAGNKIEQNLSPAHARIGGSGFLRETLVLLREIGRGNWTRVPGSFTLWIQYALVKFPALKSLLNLTTLAFGAMAAAAGYAAYKIQSLTNEFVSGSAVYNTFANTLEHAANALEHLQTLSENQAEWLRRLNEHEITLTESTNERVRAMREEFEAQQRVARANGQTPREAQRANIAEQERELREIEIAKQEAITRANDARQAEIRAARENDQLLRGPLGMAHTEDLKSQAEEARAILKAAMEDVTKQKSSILNSWGITTANPIPHRFTESELNSLDRSVQGPRGNKVLTNVNYAKYMADQIEANYLAHKAQQDASARNLEDAKRAAERAARDRDSLSQEERRRADAIQAERNNPVNNRGQLLRGELNSLQRVGIGFALPAQVEMLDVARKSERHLNHISNAISGRGTQVRGPSTNSGRGVRF